jgi:Cof subfamily protein (haloacid dehalogenase superfamily)
MKADLPRACYFDLDGTLVDSSGSIHPLVQDSIQWLHDAGILVGIATGRPWFAAKSIAKLLKVSAPCLSFSGALINDPNIWTPLYSKGLEEQQVRNIIHYCREKQWYLELYDSETYYSENHTELSSMHAEYLQTSAEIVDFNTHVGGKREYLKAVVIFEAKPSESALRDLSERIPDMEMNIAQGASHPDIYFLNLTHSNAGRLSGLNQICSTLGCTPREIMAFGDSSSDVPFLSSVEWGVAMGNASDEVKSAARYTISSVEEQGIYRFLHEFLSR